MDHYICVDIGGTSIKFGVIKSNMDFITVGETPTEAKLGGPAIIKKVQDIAKDLLKQYNAAGICVSTAGMVGCVKGRITYAAPLIPEYAGPEIKKMPEEDLHLPCEIENDVNCAGLAEAYMGAAKGSSIAVCLTMALGSVER